MMSAIKALTSRWRAHGYAGSIPCSFKIFGKSGKVRSRDTFLRRRAHRIKSQLASFNTA
jgi:hypothetical protein